MKRTGSLFVAAMLSFIGFFIQPTDGQAWHGGKMATVRVMTFNIHAGIGSDGQYDIARIADAIAQADADVVGLEEVDVHWGERSAYEDEVKRLAEWLHMYAFFAPIYTLAPDRAGQQPRQYGLAVLSRYPIVRAENHLITRLSTQTPDPVPEPAPGFPEVLINVKGIKLSFYATHLDYRADPTVRARQVQDMLAIMAQNPNPRKILVGDMNAEPDAPELAPLYQKLKDAWLIHGEDPGKTYPALQPEKRIDQILTAPMLAVRSAFRLDTLASDHLPVVADVVLTRGNPFSH